MEALCAGMMPGMMPNMMAGGMPGMMPNMANGGAMANGMGDIDDARFASSLEQITMTYEFNNAADPALYFTDAYLPEGGFGLN